MGEILLKATLRPQGVPEGQTLMFPSTAAFEFLDQYRCRIKLTFRLKVDPEMPNKILAVKFSQF